MGLQPLTYINNRSNVHKNNSSSSRNIHKTRNYQRQSSPSSSCLFLGASLLNNCCRLVSASQTAVAATAGETTVSSWFKHQINIYIDIDDKTTQWWFFMASSLLLTIFVSWWILGTAFSSSGSSVGPAGRFNFNKNSFVRSSFGGSSLQSSNSQQQGEQDLDETSSLPASGRKSKQSRNNKDGNDKNKDEKAAASAVSSSFDYFFNTNNNANSSVLKDLEPPFAMLEEYNVHPDELTAVVPQPDVTHFCFLIHGHRGLSKDLAYFQTVMQREATIEKKRNGLLPETVVENDDGDGDGDGDDVQSMEESTTDENVHNNNKGTADDVVMTEKQEEDNRPQQPQNADTHERNKRHDMVVYSSVANEGKTTDGIENGGDRLVEEMRTVIDAEMKKRYPEIVGNEIMEENTGLPATSSSENEEEDRIYDVTISMLGNSLGGLFGRYAIAKLVERHCVKEVRTIKVKGVQNDDIFSSVRAKIKKQSLNGNGGGGDDNCDEVLEEECWILDGKYRLHLNIFCTTASPHLGVSGHTWFRIPRTAEIGVAHAMGNTGKDLFRLNDLLYKMATDPVFLRPLGAFRKRIAYANCYGTDFVVPAGTAAFLSENSTYPHHFSDDYILDDNGLVIAALHTPTHVGENDEETEEHSDELHEMSSSLDKLGWKKVFVDVRKEMPSVEIPQVLRRSGTPNSETSSDNGDDGAAEGSNNEEAAAATTVTNKVEQLKKQKVVGSKDIADAVSSSVDNRVALPLGHNMIVAFSRNRVFTYANKAGRPIVDSLAKELVEDVFKWDDIYDGPVLSTKRQQQPSSSTSSSPSSSTSSTKMSRRVSDVATSSMMVTEESGGES